MSKDEQIRILSEGIRSYNRWLSIGRELINHIENGVPSGQNYDDSYITDIRSIRKALEVAQ